MRVLKGLGKGLWAGILLIGVSVVVWFIAPQAHSCVDFDATTCDTTWVVILNTIGLLLFVAGAVCLFVAGGLARSRARAMRGKGGSDPR